MNSAGLKLEECLPHFWDNFLPYTASLNLGMKTATLQLIGRRLPYIETDMYCIVRNLLSVSHTV